MKRKIFTSILLIVLIALLTVERPSWQMSDIEITQFAGDQSAFTNQLDQRIPQWLQRYEVPGAAVALVRNGEVVWSKGYGLADKARGVPVTPDTVFQVASISKSVTAWGVMRLVEKGQLNLDAPVEQYLTRWHLPPSSYDAKGVTIRRLLSHSAGLSVHGFDGFLPEQPLPSLEESLSGNNSSDHMDGGAGDVRIAMEPGAQFSYSGGGYTLLQLLVEEVTGETFTAFMQRKVLDALGMTHSSYEWRADLRPATAIGYNTSGQPMPNYLFTEQAAGGLYSTARDLARFVAAEMTGSNGELAGRGILAPESLTLVFTPVIKSEDAFLSESSGLGHFIETLPDGSMAVGHGGDHRGWKVQFWVIPERREGIVILTNSDSGPRLYTTVLRAWGHWLGTGAPSTSPISPYKQLHTAVLIIEGLAGLLGLGLVFRLVYLVRQVRAGRRQWVWRLSYKLRFWDYFGLTLSVLLTVIIALDYWILVQPSLDAFAPSQANWLTLAVLSWCLCGAAAALLQSVKAQE